MPKHRWPEPDQQGCQHQGYQQGRPARQAQLEDHADHDSSQAEHERGFIHFTQVFEQGDETVQGGGLAGQVQAQQVGQLADGNHHRRAEGEAKHH
ncbi:hypothetical protein D3C76_1503570 [compost metagenome]